MVAARHFTFDLAGALAKQLDVALISLTPEALSAANLEAVHTVPGIYQLYLRGELVYIGKADGSLRSRLADHSRKIVGRQNISIEDITFTGLYLERTWIPVGPEQMLIRKRERKGAKPPWNFNGFGINDPGKERDTTTFKQDHFDVVYPADIDVTVDAVRRGTITVADLIPVVKRNLPYVFRYQNQWARHPDYLASRVSIEDGPSMREILEAIAAALPPGWQVTVLPGYVIMYKSIRDYPSARLTFLSLARMLLSPRGIMRELPQNPWPVRVTRCLGATRTVAPHVAANGMVAGVLSVVRGKVPS